MTDNFDYQNKLTSFTFSMTAAAKTKEELNKKVKILQERIDKLVNDFTIDDLPVLKPILSLTRSKTDLKRLAKAVDRVADIVEIYDSLNGKLKIVEMVETDPNWFASTFGDFEKDIDNAINKIMAVDKEDPND